MTDDNKAAFDKFAVALIESEVAGDSALKALDALMERRAALPSDIAPELQDLLDQLRRAKGDAAILKNTVQAYDDRLSKMENRATTAEEQARSFANERELLKQERAKLVDEVERLRALCKVEP